MADVVVVPAGVRPYPESSGDPTSAPFLDNAGEAMTAGGACYFDEDLNLWFYCDITTEIKANFSAFSVTGSGVNGKIGLIKPSFTPYATKIYLGVDVIEGMLYAISPNGGGKICNIEDLYVGSIDSDGLYITPVGIGDADGNLRLLNGASRIQYLLGIVTTTTTTTP